MALFERLAIIVDASTGGAVRGLKDVSKAASDLDNSTGKSAAQLKVLEGRSAAAAATLKQGLAVGAGAAGVALVAGFAVAAKAAMGFDKAMSGVAAVANATASEMSALRQAALQAGKDTAFSASEAAKAEAELAKAGVSVKDILGGGLKGALDLAAAGQLDLAAAATIAAQALNIFELDGSQTSHVADVLAAAANKSAADVGQLGDALRQGGLLAKQTGLSLEETAGGLALFADNALIGSDAGTSFKTFLMRLIPSSSEAAEAINELGLEFVDQHGNVKDLASIAGELQTKMAGLSQEQRIAAMNTIFGSDAVRAANVLYEAGARTVQEYTGAVDDNGAAARMASTQMDNLAGDLEQLKGSMETALIKGGGGGTAALRFLTQSANAAVGAFIDLPPALQAGTVGLAGIAGVGLSAVAAFGILAPKVRDALQALNDMGPAGTRAASGLGAIGKIGGYAAVAAVGIGIVGTAVEILATKIDGGVANVDQLAASLTDLAVNGRVGGELARQFGDIDGIVERSVKAAKGAFKSGFGRLTMLDASWKNAKKDVDALDASMTALFRSGPEGKKIALDLWGTIKDGAAESNVRLSTLRNTFNDFSGALAQQRTQSDLSHQAERDASRGAVIGFEQRVKAAHEYNAALEQLKTARAGIDIGAFVFKNGAVGNDFLSDVGGSFIKALTAGLDDSAVKDVVKRYEEFGKTIAGSLDLADVWKQLETDGKASVANLTATLDKQVKDLGEWRNNLVKIAAKGAGDFAQHLQAMGPSAASLVAGVASATAPEFSRLTGVFRQAGVMSGAGWSAGLEFELRAASAIAQAHGQKSAVDLAAGLAGGISNVTPQMVAMIDALAKQLGFVLPLAVQANVELSAQQKGAVYGQIGASVVAGSRGGGATYGGNYGAGSNFGSQNEPMYYAYGDIVSRPTVGVFGEAGPEMILPLGKDKRKEAMALLRRSGMLNDMPQFASGGLFSGAGAMSAPMMSSASLMTSVTTVTVMPGAISVVAAPGREGVTARAVARELEELWRNGHPKPAWS